MNQDRTKRKLTAIFSADVVGYSRLMEADEAWTIKCLEENRGLMAGLIKEFEGRVVDAIGDNLLAEFNSVTNAVECAVKIQQELKVKNVKLMEPHRMEFRIGVNLGEVVEEDGKIYGSGVNIAARLEGLTESGGISISRRAYDHVKTSLDLGYEYLGEHIVKNISEPIRFYRVLMGPENAGKVIGEKKAQNRSSARMAFAAIVILALVVTASIGWNIFSRKSGEMKPTSARLEQSAIVSAPRESPKTIAVLPFENLSPEKDQEYFADGIAEELLNSLASISELEVRGRTSSFYFKGRKEDLQTISKMLNVEYILEGSVRKASDQVRITVQLIDTPKDAHIWSKTYERTMEDIFAVQDGIAKSVADALQITLGVGELGRRPGMTRNPAAYDAYLAGSSLKYLVERENLPRAIEQLEKAVALDPDFSICWDALAGGYKLIATLWNNSPERKKELLEKAKTAASRVVEINPNSNLALRTAATLSGDRVEEERLYKKVLSLFPEDQGANSDYASFLMDMGRPTEAVDHIKRGLRQDPLDSTRYLVLGWAYEMSNDIGAAATAMKKGKELSSQPEFYDNSLMVLAMEENNRPALYAYVAANRDSANDFARVVFDLLDAPVNAGDRIRPFFTDPDFRNFNSRVGIAVYSSFFGEDELALQSYKDLNVSEWSTFFAIWRPIHKEMRRLPGFKELVRELGMVDYWRRSGNWGEFCHPVGDDDFECE